MTQRCIDRQQAALTRLRNQQLIAPQFSTPEQVADWMGAIQAQDYSNFRWAIGMRMQNPSLSSVKQAFSTGKVVRLHLLRCTVQLIAATDLHWISNLCRERNLRTIQSWPSYTKTELSEQYIAEAHVALTEILHGNKSMTKAEIAKAMGALRMPDDTAHINQALLRGEIEGLLCSGKMEGRFSTWALTAEHTSHTTANCPNNPLASLARKYFQSHSPASFDDFHWWTGLTKTKCRQAIEAIASELEEIKVGEQTMYVFRSPYHDCLTTPNHRLHLLPPYDEYLIGYKSRHIAIEEKHSARAYNNFGIFQPVVLCDGKVVGNWKTSLSKNASKIETDIFANKRSVGARLLQKEASRLQSFLVETRQK